jgi:2-methylcitrate dehydratase PrpD
MRDVVREWLDIISPKNHPERLTEGIEADGTFSQWELLSGVVTKYYATIGPLASALEATFALLNKYDIRSEDIAEIHADCMRRTAMFNQRHPVDEVAARGSLPYCLAVAAHTRDPSQLLGRAYEPQVLQDKRVWALSEKVRITENAEYERQYPARSLARISIRLSNGTTHSMEIDRSEIARYLTPSDADIEEKFRMIAAPILGEKRAEHAIALVRNIEDVTHVGELMAALQPTR